MGIDPIELGQAPFALASSNSITVNASHLGLSNINPSGVCYILPCIAGHVGADAAAVALSEEPNKSNDLVLVVDVGTNAVQVRRSGFSTSTLDVEVLAQANPTLQDFVMSPDMPSPVGLNAYPHDEQVHLEWREPGGAAVYDMAYYDDNFEAQIGCGAPCSFSVRFTPPNYPALLTGMVLSFAGGGSAVAASVDVYLDPSGSVGGPVGED